MAHGIESADPAEEDDFLDNGDWPEEATEELSTQERGRPTPRGGPKWKAIEDYWERKRLRDALQDYIADEEESLPAK